LITGSAALYASVAHSARLNGVLVVHSTLSNRQYYIHLALLNRFLKVLVVTLPLAASACLATSYFSAPYLSFPCTPARALGYLAGAGGVELAGRIIYVSYTERSL